MDMTFLKEIVERKAAYYVRRGWDLAEALNRAVCELLAGNEDRLSPSGGFCLRACLAGVGGRCRTVPGHPEFN
ncbi:hypothetical protein [Desulfolutivibrio sulfoxidireducens]|uniref:hypothetical protein n=1 Tax=Desulfolutivibrio sulfoxidireducens TaxID=2773299 RepID=UPI00159D73B4|nr:hypothetical protein [Desulfolutivibrio sulfoxidireducens]QLA17537.1 hypothetical protein GD605_16335 [Desulfolutivibrio sulfoxidireducens]QLA21123.1 hypothetical protein GD604_16030 [Desulfolutivibrio sulfoxidireducens]